MNQGLAHKNLAEGRWFRLSLVEQMANIGSEISRAVSAADRDDPSRSNRAVERALELFDLTAADPRFKTRLKEVLRARELVCEYFYGTNPYNDSGEALNNYFLQYAVAARLNK